MRFRRSAIIAILGLGSTAIVGVAWVALKPPAFPAMTIEEDRGDVAAPTPADTLANAPDSYGDVPKLGPPLPGDLGRPILEHQRAERERLASARQDDAVQRVEAERQRIDAERRAAWESGVMMQISSPGRTAAPTPELTATSVPDDAATVPRAIDPDRDPNGQQRKADFMAARDGTSDINPHAIAPAVSPYVLSAGSVIAASLITGLSSDLPGLITAQVTENVFDSVTGTVLLVPQGARLIGRYDSVVTYGQSRALVVWQRIILPDGSSIRIENVPATDTAGYAGLADQVDRHSWQLLKGVLLSTLLGVGTELSLGRNEGDLVEAIRESAQQSGARAGDQLTARSLAIQPTIRVRPGWPLRVVVHKDLMLRPWVTAKGS